MIWFVICIKLPRRIEGVADTWPAKHRPVLSPAEIALEYTALLAFLFSGTWQHQD